MSTYISDTIEEALECFKQGGLVAMPTETVYGLAAPIDDHEAIKKIFAFKERPFFDPLIVHVSSVTQAKTLAVNWGTIHDELANTFWPGPLTIVTKKSSRVDDLITSGLATVGIRMPNHSVALELIEKKEVPLAAPSANKFTKTSPTTSQHVLNNFCEEKICILEGGACDGGIESTIVQVEESSLKILRPGLITKDDLQKIAQKFNLSIIEGKSAFDKAHEIEAPGQLPVHYRPNYELIVVEESDRESLSSSVEEVLLDTDPYVTARTLYFQMQIELKGFEARAFILPSARLNLDGKRKEIWTGIENRLMKAQTPKE